MGPRPLRVALLAYRGNPSSGGQGVYVRNLSRELTRLGHDVEVLAGPPYPDLDPGVRLTRLPSLDLYGGPEPFRFPGRDAFRDAVDVLEYAIMCTAGFPEPLTFSLRARRHLAARPADFDLVHDNQGLGYGLLGLRPPVVATVHHPITIDRDLELAAADDWGRRVSVRRWYGFARMQGRVARRLPALLTVSRAAADDIVRAFGVRRRRLTVVPNGVDTDLFRPGGDRVADRLVTTASADVPLKGLVPLLEAVAKVRTERPAELVVVGPSRPGGEAERAVARLGLGGAIRFAGRLPDAELARLVASAQVAVVPSLYEGFSLPAVEAMACATPLVATTAGALPEVVGADGHAALLVPPGDPDALATAVRRLLADDPLRRRMGAAGRRRAVERFAWRRAAEATVSWYRLVLSGRADGDPAGGGASPPC